MFRMSRKKFLSFKPTKIGTVGGISFYEHPTMGDEFPLIALVGQSAVATEWWELPFRDEVDEWL